MTQQDIYAGLTEVMRDVFEDDDLQIGSTTTAQDVPGWDSQAHVLLIVATEQRFGIRFTTAEFESLKNVGEFATLIGDKLARRG
ncbi:acyl carrier protein [Sphingomonas cannabina]|uniref:acyl carrier protein n=1 Tax=Sphingomonas cannabina TaxID=2899123 RepID=UPI001F3DF95D|nr:acyl carrier protein [Sphingomonas cannabina]UIJ44000.1 acyl carrier protein [Sphingomonas cannabina]